MIKSQDEIENICNNLVNGYLGETAITVSLDEFQKFYTTIGHITKIVPKISFVNLESTVVAQFSNISPQHFNIIGKKPLTEENFHFVSEKHWHGRRDVPQRFLEFIWAEFLQNKGKLLTIFFVSILLLFLANSDSLYDLISTFLIQSTTVFLSLYIIFTVAQNQTLFQDLSLFRRGILQKYYTDDRNVTLLGILTIAMTFLSSGIVYLANVYNELIQKIWFEILSRAFKAFSTALVITLLFDTFLTVANYYLYRNRDVIERNITSNLLDADYKEFRKKTKPDTKESSSK